METPAMLSPTLNARRRASKQKGSFVNRYYLLLKTHYFLFFSAFGILYPILNITLRGRGLTDWELSLANVIVPFIVFFTNPLLGFLADRTGRYLTTFNCVFALATILYTIIFLLPNIKTTNIQGTLSSNEHSERVLEFCATKDVTTKCASRSQCGCAYQANCRTLNSLKKGNQFNFTFLMNISSMNNISSNQCGNEYRVSVEQAMRNKKLWPRFPKSTNSIARCDITCTVPHFCEGARELNQFTYVLLYSFLFILGNNFLSNAIPLGASIGFAALENPEDFGKQRVFGTIGFGISAFFASLIYGIFQTEYVYIIMFGITTILCIIVTILIPIRSDEQQEPEDEKKEKSQLSALVPLLKKIDVIVFLLLTFLWGMPYAGLDPYLYLYVDEIAPCASRSIIGWMSLSSAAAEITGFFLAGKVLKFLGTNIASVVILLAFSVRFAGYYLISYPYLLAAMESMHFFNFGILYVLIVQKADSIAPPGLSGTLQGVALGVTFGLGRGVGLLISSFIYRLFEQRILFLVISIFNLVAAIIFSIYFFFNRENTSPANPKLEVEEDTKLKEEPLLKVSTVNEQ